MSGRLSDLNAHLFSALDRLANDKLTPEQLEAEVKRADAIVGLADQVIENAKTTLVAARLYAEHGDKILPHLPLIGKADK
jgi:hypothetical protein